MILSFCTKVPETLVGDLVAVGFGCLRLVPLAQQSYNGWARYRGN